MVMIRECRKEDFGQVLKLLAQLWPEKTLGEKQLQQVFLRGLSSEFQSYVCAVVEESIVGFGSLTIKNNLWVEGYIGHIDELVVDKEYRGREIGSKLLEYIINIARNKNCRRLELDSAFDRKKAHKFYERNGFENRAFLFSKRFKVNKPWTWRQKD
ncbi:MAG: GNAT family N-acetyltransferase [Planctomycetota bacterium]|jgi:ribosomal protein S18 acetylase RimI-like enzyme